MLLGSELKIDYSEYEEYFNTVLDEDLNSVTSDSIENIFKEEIEKQIKQDIEDIGYYVKDISLDINLQTGEISNLIIYISESKEEYSNNSIIIENIEIGENIKYNNNLSEEEISDIKELLEEKYNINTEKISISSI